jgi:glucosamine--fructose-6-phosphate aminotransferase (isomerizing)
MCGVLGYVGHRDARRRLLAGLARLEYRGYDSAGIAVLAAGGRLEVVKAVGRLDALERACGPGAARATTGIGHTRWATHGRVTEANAHPLTAGEVVAVTADGARITTAGGDAVVREEQHVDAGDGVADRGGHETFMLKEIHEQPEAVAATLAANLRPNVLGIAPMLALGTVDNRDLARFRRVVFVGCGTAYHAGLLGRIALHAWAGLPCTAEIASEWRTVDPLLDEHTLVVGVSQSGETADTLGALRLARDRGARTLAVTNCPGSQITREVDAVLYTHAGLEVGVAATKTFTAQVALLYLLALRFAQLRGALPNARVAELVGEVRALPPKLTACLEGADAVEMKHGPIALLGEGTPVVCVATPAPEAGKLLLAYHVARRWGLDVDRPRNLAKTVTVE